MSQFRNIQSNIYATAVGFSAFSVWTVPVQAVIRLSIRLTSGNQYCTILMLFTVHKFFVDNKEDVSVHSAVKFVLFSIYKIKISTM